MNARQSHNNIITTNKSVCKCNKTKNKIMINGRNLSMYSLGVISCY